MATKASAEVTVTDRTDATAIRAWYHAQTSAVAPSAPTTTDATATPSGWTLAEPTISSASDLSKYVYRCEQLVWGDGTCDWGTVTLSASYEAAKVAYNEAQTAKTTATRYINELVDGIMVHPYGDITTGWSIRDALELIKSGISVFRVWLEGGLAKVRIGESDKSHVELDYHSLQMVDRNDNTYFHISDLRDADGWVTNDFIGDGSTTRFDLVTFTSVPDSMVVTVDNTIVTTGISKLTSYVLFRTAPASGSVVTVKFLPGDTSSEELKAFTLGTRLANSRLGLYSVAEGVNNTASNDYTHATGAGSIASGFCSHADGYHTTASGRCSHSDGAGTTASGSYSHADGNGTKALGLNSHASGCATIAGYDNQTAIGKHNDNQPTNIFEIGNGTDANNPSNAFAVDWNGNTLIDGDVQDTSGNKLYADVSHTHSASDIGSGILSESYGGTGKSALVDAVYPVGAIYMSVASTSPATLFGGTWERITGKFLLAATDGGASGGNSNASIAAGKTGGEASHALTPAETATKDHSHTMNHGHGFTQPTITVKRSQAAASGSATYVPSVSGSNSVTNVASASGGAVTNHTGSTGGQTAANGSAHNNMPPYLAVYVWKRTA